MYLTTRQKTYSILCTRLHTCSLHAVKYILLKNKTVYLIFIKVSLDIIIITHILKLIPFFYKIF